MDSRAVYRPLVIKTTREPSSTPALAPYSERFRIDAGPLPPFAPGQRRSVRQYFWHVPVLLQRSALLEHVFLIFLTSLNIRHDAYPVYILNTVLACGLALVAYALIQTAGFDPKSKFTKKKEVTSAMRRIAPIGVATAIGWSCNFRTLRFVIEQRTSRHAEEEIRLVFNAVARIVFDRYPAIFADFTVTEVNGYGEWVPEFRKV